MRMEMSISEIQDELYHGFVGAMKRNKEPRSYLIFGSPGMGKTQSIYQVAERVSKTIGKPVNVKVVLAGCIDPADVVGFPEKEGEYARYLPFKWAYDTSEESKNKNPMILFFDDLLLADEKVQGAFFRVALERYIGDLKMRSNVFVVAASNYEDDNAGACSLNKALENRFRILHTKVDSESWFEWAEEKGDIHPYVISYIRTHPSHLHNYKKGEDAIHATPRSWENVSDYLFERNIRTGAELPKTASKVLSGIIGGVGPSFVSWVKTAKGAIPPKKLIENPDSVTLPGSDQIDILYTTVYGFASYILENRSPEAYLAAFKIAMRLDPEFGFILLKKITKSVMDLEDEDRSKVVNSQELDTVIEKFGKLLPINLQV